MNTISLDLGCGPEPRNPYNADIVCGIDVRNDLEKNVVKADLVTDPIPFDNNFFDYVIAHDFIEHIPRLIYTPERRNPFIELMNEIWRVLKPNGVFHSKTPAMPHLAVFQDPTHVNFITEQTFTLYFDHQRIWAKPYGFNGAFIIKEQYWKDIHLHTIMIKTDPPLEWKPHGPW